jgi:HK97 family phage portal protein
VANFYNALRKWLGIDDDGYSDRVSFKQAMSVPAVWKAHTQIVGDVGRMPVDVKKLVGDGAENDYQHPGYRLLREEPNLIQSPTMFKEQITSHAIMHGNGRAAIIYDGGVPVELIPMMPDRTWTLIYKGEKYHLTKQARDDKKNFFEEWPADPEGFIAFPDREVLHIPGFSYNGVEGMGLLDIGQSTFGIAVSSMQHWLQQLRKGFRGKLFLQVPPGQLRDEGKAREFLESFNRNESGPDNAGKAAMLREGVTASAINMSNNDAQYADLQKLSRQDIGMLFGLDSMPGDGDSVSYNSLEQKNLAYLRALDCWLVRWEEECDRKLRTAIEKRKRSRYFKFNRQTILRTDATTTMTVLCNAITHRIMSPNEARAKLDMNPYEGGDVYANPAVTPGPAVEVDDEEDSSDDAPNQPPADANARALEETIRSLLIREANNAISGSKSRNFVDWIDKNYAKWEAKLAEKLEILGLDRDLARIHCDESRSILLEIAGNSTPETLENNVKTAVKDWQNRVFTLIGGQT